MGEGRRAGVIEGEAGYQRRVMAEAPRLVRMVEQRRTLMSASVPGFLASPRWMGSEVLVILSSVS